MTCYPFADLFADFCYSNDANAQPCSSCAAVQHVTSHSTAEDARATQLLIRQCNYYELEFLPRSQELL